MSNAFFTETQSGPLTIGCHMYLYVLCQDPTVTNSLSTSIHFLCSDPKGHGEAGGSDYYD